MNFSKCCYECFFAFSWQDNYDSFDQSIPLKKLESWFNFFLIDQHIFYSNTKPKCTASSRIMIRHTELAKLKLNYSLLKRRLLEPLKKRENSESIRPIHSSYHNIIRKGRNNHLRNKSEVSNSIVMPADKRCKRMAIMNISLSKSVSKYGKSRGETRNTFINEYIGNLRKKHSTHRASTSCSSSGSKCIVLQKCTNTVVKLPKMCNISVNDKSEQADFLEVISDCSPASSPSPRMKPKFCLKLFKL